MNNLQERIDRWIAEGRPIGFSPWRDAEGALWGIPLRYDEKMLLVDEISCYGEREGEHGFLLSSMSYFQESAIYSERLLRLAGFTRTKAEQVAFVRDRAVVKAMLKEACSTGEVLRCHLRAESGSRTLRALWCDESWVEFAEFDELMDTLDSSVWRISCVEALRWRTAKEEADEFLLASRRK